MSQWNLLVVTANHSTQENDDFLDFTGFSNLAPMPYAASDMAVVSYLSNTPSNARIYLFGGCVSDQACDITDPVTNAVFCYCTQITNRVIYFQPEDGSWHTNVASMPVERYRHMAARVGDYIYVAGGRYLNDSLIQTIDRYDVINNIWVANWLPWPEAISDAGTFAFGNSLYFVGGYDAYYNTLANMTSVDVTTKVWTTNYPSMQLGRGDIAVTQLGPDAFYVLGGWNAETSEGWCKASSGKFTLFY